jgi:hypothetical protein
MKLAAIERLETGSTTPAGPRSCCRKLMRAHKSSQMIFAMVIWFY